MTGTQLSNGAFYYRDVIADLKARAAKLLDIAAGLEGFVLLEEPAPLKVLPTPNPKVRRANGTRKPGALTAAVLEALENYPLSPADLKKRLPGVLSGTVHATCFALKSKKLIFKGADGRWCIGQPGDVAPAKETADPVPDKAPTIAATIRQAAAEPVARTRTELADRVMALLPGISTRNNILSMIGQQIDAKKLWRDENGMRGVQPIVDGKVIHAPANAENGRASR